MRGGAGKEARRAAGRRTRAHRTPCTQLLHPPLSMSLQAGQGDQRPGAQLRQPPGGGRVGRARALDGGDSSSARRAATKHGEISGWRAAAVTAARDARRRVPCGVRRRARARRRRRRAHPSGRRGISSSAVVVRVACAVIAPVEWLPLRLPLAPVLRYGGLAHPPPSCSRAAHFEGTRLARLLHTVLPRSSSYRTCGLASHC